MITSGYDVPKTSLPTSQRGDELDEVAHNCRRQGSSARRRLGDRQPVNIGPTAYDSHRRAIGNPNRDRRLPIAYKLQLPSS